jgi:hypothetical protein
MRKLPLAFYVLVLKPRTLADKLSSWLRMVGREKDFAALSAGPVTLEALCSCQGTRADRPKKSERI